MSHIQKEDKTVCRPAGRSHGQRISPLRGGAIQGQSHQQMHGIIGIGTNRGLGKGHYIRKGIHVGEAVGNDPRRQVRHDHTDGLDDQVAVPIRNNAIGGITHVIRHHNQTTVSHRHRIFLCFFTLGMWIYFISFKKYLHIIFIRF